MDLEACQKRFAFGILGIALLSGINILLRIPVDGLIDTILRPLGSYTVLGVQA